MFINSDSNELGFAPLVAALAPTLIQSATDIFGASKRKKEEKKARRREAEESARLEQAELQRQKQQQQKAKKAKQAEQSTASGAGIFTQPYVMWGLGAIAITGIGFAIYKSRK